MRLTKIEKNRKLFLLGILSLTGFVTSFGAYIVAANLPAYSRETGAGLILIGVLIALYDVAEILAKPLGGLLSRSWGEWAVLRTGLMIFSIASGIYIFLPPAWLILIRLMQGAGAAFFSVMSMTLLIRYFADRKGAALGIYGSVKNTGYVLAPTIGGFWVYRWGFQSVFLLCLGIGLLVIVFTYLIRPGSPSAGFSPADNKKRNTPGLTIILNSLKNRRSLPIFLIMFFNMIFMAAFFGFMPILLSGKGLDPLRAGFILALNAVVYLAVQPFAGRVSDSFGRKKLITLGLTVSTVSIAALPFLGYPYYILGGCVLALGIGCVSPLGEAFVGDVSDDDDLALNLGVAGSYRELGEMVGPVSMGFVGQTIGLDWAFLLVGVSGIASLFCILFLRENRVKPCVETTPLSW